MDRQPYRLRVDRGAGGGNIVKRRKPDLRSVTSTLGVIVVVAAAAVVWHHLPTPTDLYGPFDVHAHVGVPADGRAVTATVTSVRIAPRVNSVQAAGTWVVVDTTLAATRATELPRSDLTVGPNTYTPSDRFFFDTLGSQISPGITESGAWVFDVAPELVPPGASASLTLRVWVGTAFLDSRLVISIPLNDSRVSRSDDVNLTSPKVAAP